MALQKTLINPLNGATANYWRVYPVYNPYEQNIFIVMEGYVDQNIAENYKLLTMTGYVYQIIYHPTVQELLDYFNMPTTNPTVPNPFKAAYDLAKTRELAGGTDC